MFSWLALVHDVQGVKLKVVTFVKPGADEVIEPEAGSAGEGQSFDMKAAGKTHQSWVQTPALLRCRRIDFLIPEQFGGGDMG